MSLATRCTSCGTVFRVVQDQLRVSSGWVRCGRCSEVFNAIESLVDLDLDRPGEGASASVHGARVMEELARVSGGADSTPSSLWVEAPSPSPTSPASAAPASPFPSSSPFQPSWPAPPQAPTPASDSSHFPNTEVPADIFGHAEADLAIEVAQPMRPQPAPASSSASAVSPPATSAPLPPASMPGDFAASPDVSATRAPGFVRQADRAARWRHPGVRAVLAVLVLASVTVLAWQVHWSHHDWLVARWPALQPAMERLCRLSGCRIEPPRRIESLVVESSGLVRAGAAGTYRLSVVMRNRDRLALRTPSIDLSLTDSQGRVIARRVLQAAELGTNAASVAPGAELALSATLRARDTPVVGYTIEIFYP